ncbi:fimbrial protein [Buttiauxella noackiae]|uniref:PapA family protein n=1 Tax=Buttiauxella noackiae ATCC 51607 TaxID=1354255 RepID=A0A1B7I0I3_9ENTR|nr:fimbrial protein [Buttiauxella noackiae]OAT21570.1 PapA family protein [Buttiauxella noackiae ATCC 51607]
MKLNKFAMAAVIAAGITSASAFAVVAPTNGVIQLKGELVESACGLAASSSPVTVDFGQIPTSALAKNKQAGNVHKEIELQDCDTTTAKTAKVTYTPNTVDVDNSALAAFTSGTAKGAGIGLIDNGNQPVVWGHASSPVTLVNGTNHIPFVAYVKADTASTTVTPGTFQSEINFQIDYQ